MFDFLFGWRKASSCKRLLRRIQCRLKLLKSKRTVIVRQVRDDVGQLLKIGYDQTVLNRVEQLYMDESILTVYELLGHFCEFITINLPYIRRHKECPNDVNEAVSSLVYASARCGDVPELKAFRELFEDRYGLSFIRTALDLLPGNLVNIQIIEKLSITSVPNDAKFRLVNEIFKENCIQNLSMAIQYSQEWHLQETNESKRGNTLAPERQLQELNVQEIEKQTTMFAPATNSLSEDRFSLHAKYSMDIGKRSPMHLLAQECIVAQSEMEKSAQVSHVPSLSSCSDTSVHLPDDELIYMDDVEEFKSPKLNEFDSLDKRIFMFKSLPSTIAQTRGNEKHRYSTRLRKSSAPKGRKLQKRSLSRESMNIEDLEYERYYTDSFCDAQTDQVGPLGEPGLLKKVLVDTNETSSLKRGRIQLQVSRDVNSHRELDVSSLGSSCYLTFNNNKSKHRTYRLRRHQKNQHSGSDPKQSKLIQEPGSRLGHRRDSMEKRMKHEDTNLGSLESSNGSNSVLSTPTNRSVALTFYVRDAETRYMRAFTMPADRPTDRQLDSYSRTSSLPVPNQLNHVHPKLPDYDDLEAKFVALKQAQLHNQCH